MPEHYSDRLERFLALLRARQSSVEGGWGLRLDLDGAPLSIVTTVQGLRALRAVRTSYEDQAVQDALAYVADKVVAHPFERDARHPEGRGPHARYVAFGLLGLTSYDEARHDPKFAEAQRACVKWLGRHVLEYGGGWSDHPSKTGVALVATSPAIRALDRVCPRDATAALARDLSRRARDELVRTARGHRSRYWAQSPDWSDPSFAATALAVLALVGGNDKHQDAAAAGARWLMERTKEWSRLLELDERLERTWTHMSYSLALRAVVSPAGCVDPTDRRLRPVLQHLDSLWDDKHGAWTHGRPGGDPTTAGSSAVVSATETLRRVWRFDPVVDLQRRRLTKRIPAISRENGRRPLLTLEGSVVVIVDEAGARAEFNLHKASAQRAHLQALIERHVDGREQLDMLARTVGEQELAERFDVKPQSIQRSMRRLNERARAAAHTSGATVHTIVEEREVDGEPGVARWGLTADVGPDATSKRA